MALALHGFRRPCHLVGLQPADLESLFESPVSLATVRRGVHQLEAVHLSTVIVTECSLPVRAKSSLSVADQMAPGAFETAEASIIAMEAALNVPTMSLSMRPREAVENLVLAQSAGMDPKLLLDIKADHLRNMSVQGSYRSVASALRCWHRFATGILSYTEEATLPPKSSEHAVLFVTIFRKAKTAENYLGSVRWACVRLGLKTDWRDASVMQALARAKKRTISILGDAQRQNFLLTTSSMVQLVQMLVQLDVPRGMLVLAVLAWQFLLRVQSAGVMMCAGDTSCAHGLQHGVNGVVWMFNQEVHLRLRRRKHRPNGSWLRCKCSCDECVLLCPVHFVGVYVAQTNVGTPLLNFTVPQCVNAIKRALTLLGVENARCFSLKAFRAGHATELAKKGTPIGQILKAGEWRSSAFLRYVDEDVVDANSFANEILDSQDEGL